MLNKRLLLLTLAETCTQINRTKADRYGTRRSIRRGTEAYIGSTLGLLSLQDFLIVYQFLDRVKASPFRWQVEGLEDVRERRVPSTDACNGRLEVEEALLLDG